jgi:hypothetical protein
MPPRTRRAATTEPAEITSEPAGLVPGAAVLLPDGGEALVLAVQPKQALLKVGTGPRSVIWVPLEGLEAVPEATETERHANFRADARRRGEVGS